MERWRRRTALVTGASSGIGYAIAEGLAKAGLTVVGCAEHSVDNIERKQATPHFSRHGVQDTCSTVKALAKKLQTDGGNNYGAVHAIKCDLTKEDDIMRMFNIIEAKFKHVDVLVNNAGLAHSDDLLTGKTEKWRQMIELNVFGVSVCTREALRLMDKHHIDDGHIINMNSVAGHNIFANMAVVHFYAGTKHMVTALSKALNAELRQKKSKIRVTSISPGNVATNLFTTHFQAGITTMEVAKQVQDVMTGFQFLAPKDIADAIIYALGTPPNVAIHELTIVPTDQPLP